MLQFNTHLLFSLDEETALSFDKVIVDYFIDENEVEEFEFQQLLKDYCPYEIPSN